MAEGDTPATGPQSIAERLDAAFAEPEKVSDTHAGEVEELEETPEDEAEGDEPEAEAAPETTEDPSEGDGEEPQVLTLDEYGDILVEIDGKRSTLAELSKGTLRQSDYSRKTQQLAEERKSLEADRARLAEDRRQLQAAILQAEGDEPEPDWEKLFEEDPIDAPRQKLIWDKKQAQKAKARQEAEQAQQRQTMEFRAATAQVAVEKFPEWREPEAYSKGEPARRKAALHAGFTEQEYNSAHDMRLAVLLELAARGMAKADTAAVVEKKVTRRPAVMKPGAVKTKAEQDAAERAAIKRKLARPMSTEERLKLVYGE